MVNPPRELSPCACGCCCFVEGCVATLSRFNPGVDDPRTVFPSFAAVCSTRLITLRERLVLEVRLRAWFAEAASPCRSRPKDCGEVSIVLPRIGFWMCGSGGSLDIVVRGGGTRPLCYTHKEAKGRSLSSRSTYVSTIGCAAKLSD